MAKAEKELTPLEIAAIYADRLPAWSTGVALQALEAVLNDGPTKEANELALKKTKSYKDRKGVEVKAADLMEVAPIFTVTLLNHIANHIAAGTNLNDNPGKGVYKKTQFSLSTFLRNKWSGIKERRHIRKRIKEINNTTRKFK